MEILPKCSTHCAGNSDEVVQAPEAPGNGPVDEIRVHLDPGTGSHTSMFEEIDPADLAANHESTESAVADKDVRAVPEEKPRDLKFPSDGHRLHELIRRSCAYEEVRGAADSERRERCKGDIDFDDKGCERSLKMWAQVVQWCHA